jgi:hypothetical protein
MSVPNDQIRRAIQIMRPHGPWAQAIAGMWLYEVWNDANRVPGQEDSIFAQWAIERMDEIVQQLRENAHKTDDEIRGVLHRFMVDNPASPRR